eukprot:5869612-Alexandrium_andersonii.AAC.1
MQDPRDRREASGAWERPAGQGEGLNGSGRRVMVASGLAGTRPSAQDAPRVHHIMVGFISRVRVTKLGRAQVPRP